MENFRFNKRYRGIDKKHNELIDAGAPSKEELEDFLKKLETREFVPIPRRIKEAETFVAMIMEFCDLFEYDMEISRSENEISAIMKINVLVLSGYCKDYFNRILTMADEINIHPNPQNENLLIIRYYTHEVYFNGKKTRNIK